MSSEYRENRKIALSIRAVRSLLGLNLRQLADVLGVAPSTIGKWESNDLTLKATTYMKLVRYLETRGVALDLLDEPSGAEGDEIVIRIKRKCVDDSGVLPVKEVNTLI
jgi:transcriptional regulator with XRE-family HTH domain